MSLTLPDFSAVPMTYRQAAPAKGTMLDEFELDHFGGSLSAWVYLNDINFKYIHPTYRLTDAQELHITSDEGMMEMYAEEEMTATYPAVSLFVDGGEGIPPTLPDPLVAHLNFQIARLRKPIHCDLHTMLWASLFGQGYQEDEDEDRDLFAGLPAWMLRVHQHCHGEDGWHQVPGFIERTPEFHFDGPHARAITAAVTAVLEAERTMLADEGPLTAEYLGPEEGLFNFGFRHIEFDPDLISAAWNGQSDMCDNHTGNLIHICSTETQLRKALRYLRTIDQLHETLWQIHHSTAK